MTVPASASSGLAPDQVLPQRDWLLDPQWAAARLATRLSRRGTMPITACERVRVKYRVGESLRVVYEITAAGERYTVAARTFPGGRSAEAFESAMSTSVPTGAVRPVVHDRELETVFWVFPNDRKVLGVDRLLSPRAVPGDDTTPTWWVRSRVASYAPERAVTVQCIDATGRARGYAKVYADGAAAASAAHTMLHDRLSDDSPTLRVPNVIAHDPARRMLVVEPAGGQRLPDIDVAEWGRALNRFGAALATLHGLRCPDATAWPPFARFDLAKLLQATRVTSRVRPDLASAATALGEAFASHPAPRDEPDALLHGDVSSKNWFIHSGAVTLIDLDQMAVGPAAAEIGSVLAGLRLRRHTGTFSVAREVQLAGAFLRGYASAGTLPDPTAIRWHSAAALLMERALRGINRVRRGPLDHLGALIADAHLMLAGLPDA